MKGIELLKLISENKVQNDTLIEDTKGNRYFFVETGFKRVDTSKKSPKFLHYAHLNEEYTILREGAE